LEFYFYFFLGGGGERKMVIKKERGKGRCEREDRKEVMDR
jgi:hypothetical protein